MAISVEVRAPVCSVTIQKRDGSRIYSSSDLASSIYAVSTSRALSQSSGAFEIVLAPNDINIDEHIGTWKDRLDPMDYVEITIDSGIRPAPSVLPNRIEPAIVMRGFIDNVSYTGALTSGTPSRNIAVTGRDFGKLALINTLYGHRSSKSALAPSLEILQTMMSMQYETMDESLLPSTTGQTTAAGKGPPDNPWTPDRVMALLFNSLLGPVIQMTTGGRFGHPGMLKFDLDPYSISSLQTWHPALISNQFEPFQAIWQLFEYYANRPWQELFFDDDNLEPFLKYRTTPWRGIDGNAIGGSNPIDAVEIDPDWILQWGISKSDQEVFNLFMTQPLMFEGIPQLRLSMGDISGPCPYISNALGKNPVLITGEFGGYQQAFPSPQQPKTPSAFPVFGIRTINKQSPYFNVARAMSTKQIDKNVQEIGEELEKRLVQAMSFNELLWQGTLNIKGTPTVHIGDYIVVDNWEDNTYKFYVEGVQHSFQFPVESSSGSYTTMLVLTRGQVQ